MAIEPYATIKAMVSNKPSWIADPNEQMRIAAYDVYESIYWSVDGTFKLVARGTEDKPIYIPSGRTVVETMHRFTAPKPNIVPDPLFGDDTQQLLAKQVWTDFARRERFLSRFNANKRNGLIRGDWAWHIYGLAEKAPSTRISLEAVDPGMVFPIRNPNNLNEIIGYHIAEPFEDGDKTRVRRLTYRKTTGMGGPSPIEMSDAIYEVDKWGGPGMDPADEEVVQVITPPVVLPQPIDSLPIYWIPNRESDREFGSSEMKGIERIIAAINQGISDEDLALALEGLGVYATDAGKPQDENGNDTDWTFGPGGVVELPSGKSFKRVNGVGTMTPYQQHLDYLHSRGIDETLGIPAAAKGRVEVSIAESGIALMLELAPLLSSAEEKEATITDRLTNLLYDLPKWFVAYEGSIMSPLLDTRLIPTYGAKLPPNTSKDLAELLKVAQASPQIVPMSYVRQRMRLIGFDDMPDDATLDAAILAEQEARARVQQDAFGAAVDNQVQSELNGNVGG